MNHAKFRIAKLHQAATADDVPEGRVLFTLVDQGMNARLVELPKFLQPVRWSKPLAVGGAQLANGSTIVKGQSWQAEEVWHDGKWRRYFGFVGKHDIARVPAEQIEFVDVGQNEKR